MSKINIVVVLLAASAVICAVLLTKAIKEELEDTTEWYQYTKSEEARIKLRECKKAKMNSVIHFKDGIYNITCAKRKDDEISGSNEGSRD